MIEIWDVLPAQVPRVVEGVAHLRPPLRVCNRSVSSPPRNSRRETSEITMQSPTPPWCRQVRRPSAGR